MDTITLISLSYGCFGVTGVTPGMYRIGNTEMCCDVFEKANGLNAIFHNKSCLDPINWHTDKEIIEQWDELEKVNLEFAMAETSAYNKAGKLVTGYKCGDVIYTFNKKFVSNELLDMTGVFKLSDGRFAVGSYGKYTPNITFISNCPVVNWGKADGHKWGADHEVEIVKGRYFVSKKGTKMLDVTSTGHVLVCDSWGGAFNDYKGNMLKEENALYFRRAHSNGCGSGNDYAVFSDKFSYMPSAEDL